MLGKLIKHEFRATGRVMLPLLGAVLVLSPIVGFIIRTFDRENYGGPVQLLGGTVVVLFFFAVAGICITSVVLMVRRFNSNLLQDEGYLMFTLPVSTHSLIWSKLIVSFVWFVVAAVSSAAFIAIVALTSHAEYNLSVVILFTDDLTQLVGGWNIAAYILEALVCLFLFSCVLCLHFYAAMALGHSFSDHKTFLSVCFYVLLSIVSSWLMLMLSGLFKDGILSRLAQFIGAWTDGMQKSQEYALVPHVVFLGIGAYLLVVSALYYIPTILPLKKSLNIN